MTQPRYVAADAADAFEHRRLELLEELLDPVSTRHLDGLGVAPGVRCLEVGGGAGSIARWMARRVAPGGSVVVTDLDPRFLHDLASEGIQVRVHDILLGPVEPGAFDVVHARAVLMHLRDPAAALRHLMAAAKPGGWVLIEEPDYGFVAAADPAHPEAAWFGEIWRAIVARLAASELVTADYGRRVRQALESAGAAEVGCEGSVWLRRGGDPAARFAQMHNTLLAKAGVLDEADARRQNALYDDPSFRYVDAALFSAWGARP
jgi:2-polyprenyl-3-methyl-5-hydroxy-6-metoxy-1,4-benzoquinol methylase